MVPSKYTELLHGIRIVSVSNTDEFERGVVSSISTDTRELKNGDLFIAIPGERFDGHRFIGDAVSGGARAVLFESVKKTLVKKHIKANPAVLFIGVDDTRKTFGSIARNYSKKFSVKKIVVTGSAGKTTTKALIKHVLSQRYTTLASIESYNNDIGVPKTLLCLGPEIEVLVQEIGTNHPGEIGYLAGLVQAENALITNIGPAHIGFFGSEQKIAQEKKAALTALPPGGTAFLNRDDRFYEYLREEIDAAVKTFGLTQGDVHPERIIERNMETTSFVLLGKTITAPLLGSHGVVNAAAAALVGLHFGLDAEEVLKGIETLEPIEGRGAVFERNGITIIDESYNANPISVSAAIDYLCGLTTQGRRIFVFGDMLELGDESQRYHRALAEEVVKKGIEVLYTYGPLAGMTGESVAARGKTKVHRFEDRERLVDALEKDARRGDIVLVKGSRAMRLEQIVRRLTGL